jgi:hypothetical protein
MCLRRAPEKYIAGAALDRAASSSERVRSAYWARGWGWLRCDETRLGARK